MENGEDTLRLVRCKKDYHLLETKQGKENSVSHVLTYVPLTNFCSILSEVKVAQSCPTLCDPMDYTVHGILWAGILECVV